MLLPTTHKNKNPTKMSREVTSVYKPLNNKKADMAIGTLIIFISMIVVAAIAAGVIIQTATALQNKALLTGEKAKQQVGTGITTILIYGEDGSDKTLESFYMKVKLSPGSDPLKFKDMLLEIDTPNSSIDAIYGERIRNLDNNSWYSLDTYMADLNEDNVQDYIMVYNSTHMVLNISNGSTTSSFRTYVQFVFDSNYNTNISAASSALPVYIRNFNSKISAFGETYGTLSMVGYTSTANELDGNVLVIVGKGTALEQGGYAVDYLLKGANWKEGYLQRGDVVKMALVAPHEIGEDEEIDVRIIPKSGSPRTVSIVVPDLVNNRRVYMFS
jgi:archaellin